MSKVGEAIFEVQKKLKTISMDSEQAGGRATWNYASFKAISEALKPLLIEHDLKVTHTQRQDFDSDIGSDASAVLFTLTTEIEHMTSGQVASEAFRVQLQDPTNSQEIGGKITYGKRYNLNCMFNLVFNQDQEDTDGAVPTVEATPEKIAEGIAAEDALTLSALIEELNRCESKKELKTAFKKNTPRHKEMGRVLQLVYVDCSRHISKNFPEQGKPEAAASAA
tara:strand:+ start:1774 stop:2442 length:669 start_codon:yes stop_codon:yes gene_type:complete